MPPPSSYTEDSLALYMRDEVLKATGQVLGLTELGQFADAVLEVQLAIGDTWSTDIRRTRIVARQEAWRVALAQAGGDYAYTEDGVVNNRQQIFDHCRLMFEQAEAEVIALGPVPGSDEATAASLVSRGSFAARNRAVW